ncbi:MAG: phage baseplate assembly protein V [Terriglobales bacterium]
MEPVRFSPSLPHVVEPELSDARAETKPDASVESAASSTTASSSAGKVFQPSTGDEVFIAFENGEQRMAFLTGALWKTDTPPTSAPPPVKGPGATGGTQPKVGAAQIATGHKVTSVTDKHVKVTDDYPRILK